MGSRGQAGAPGDFPQLAAAPGWRATEPPCPSAPAAAAGKAGRAGGREAEEEEGLQQGCSRRTGDARAGKARDLNLSLTRLWARSLPPSLLTALLQCSRTEPGASCPLLSSAGLVGAS